MFEVLGTHYLELYSDKAQVETDKAIAKEFLNEGVGGMESEGERGRDE